ncbi:hypothetical protein [Streptomyces sp. NPDC051677]|uniref:hypothetical protein n=1 Tax=Streptomyces sp. NPDC051677 TaxID=3365669 RepID=UPI0037CECC34
MDFEDELAHALRRTAGSFTTDRRSLAEGSLTRGRRRLARRRRAGVVAGSTLAVVLVATAGLRLNAPHSGDGPVRGEQAATPRPTGAYRHFAVAAQEMKNILRNGMNQAGIAVAHPSFKATGSNDSDLPATATIDFDDSWGAAMVTLSVRRVDPAQPALKKLITCPPAKDSPYEECTQQPDNRAVKGYTQAGKAGGVKEWAVTMLSPNGYLIDVTTHNLPAAQQTEAASVSRNPRMNPGKLRYLAMFVDASLTGDGEAVSLGTLKPGAEAEPGDILPLLKTLLPQRLHVTSEGGTESEGHVVVIDRTTGRRTYIQATRIAGDKEFWNRTLPDGTKVGTLQAAGRQPGVVQLRADALRVNGLRMSLTAYNAPTPTSKRSGVTPLITIEELSGR